MNRRICSFTILLFSMLSMYAQDDAGTWISTEMVTPIGRRWQAGAGGELRLKANFASVDRWQLTANANYKASRYLKLGASYEFHLKNRQLADGEKECVPRHRLMVDATPQVKLCSWLKLSLRERYQYTHMMAKSGIAATDEHHLRSRLKVDFSTNTTWSPYVSCEVFNRLDDEFHIDEMRLAAGSAYALTSHYMLSFGYLLDVKYNGISFFGKRNHIIQASFTYKL